VYVCVCGTVADRSAGGDAEAALSAGDVELEGDGGLLRCWPPKSSHTLPTAPTAHPGITSLLSLLCGYLSLLLS